MRQLTDLPSDVPSRTVRGQGGLLPATSINEARNQLRKTGQELEEAVSGFPTVDQYLQGAVSFGLGDAMASLPSALEPQGSFAQGEQLRRLCSRDVSGILGYGLSGRNPRTSFPLASFSLAGYRDLELRGKGVVERMEQSC